MMHTIVNVLLALLTVSAGATADERMDATDSPTDNKLLGLAKSETIDERKGDLSKLLDDEDAVDKLVDDLLSKLANKLHVRMPLPAAGRMPLPSAGFPPLAQRVAPNRMCCTHATYEVKQPKPIGVSFKNAKEGIIVSRVTKDADPRIKVGDKLVVVSASFGSELWPAKSYQQTMMALNTRIGLVYMKFEASGKAGSRFGGGNVGPVTEFICLDCGYAYVESSRSVPFKQLPGSFVCPQCSASKGRFARKNPETGQLEKSASFDLDQLANYGIVVLGLATVGILAYIGLNL